MSNAQIQTRLEQWSHARFPSAVTRLHALYARLLLERAAEELNGRILIEAARHLSNPYEYRHPCTVSSNDGYYWARGLVFKVIRAEGVFAGQAAILFPRARDAARQHGTSTDRSIAVYCDSEVTGDDLDQLVVQYHNAFLSTVGVVVL